MTTTLQERFKNRTIITTKNQLSLFDTNLKPTFNTQNSTLAQYNFACTELKLGDCGKCMLTYHPQTNTITFRTGKIKNIIPNLPNDHTQISHYDLRTDREYHKQTFGPNEIGLGGGGYAVFEKGKIVAGDDSGDYKMMHKTILQECIKQSKLELFFLEHHPF